MLFTILFLVAFSFVAEGHMHISGVPMVTGNHLGPHRRLFVPIDPNFCNAQAQQAPISCLQSTAGGTPYCSAYLNIPTITVCTTATVPPAAGTTTVTSTLGQTAAGSGSNVKRADVIRETPVVQNDAISPAWRRIVRPRQANACIPASQSAPYSSSVCSCLNIPTPTTTTTFSYTLPAAVTQTVVVTPSASQSYSTITSYYTGTALATSTFPPSSAGQPGTVIVYSPQAYVTSTSYYTGSVAATSTIPPATPGQPATVVVYSPQSYVTTTSTYTGTIVATSTIPPATPGQPGTVVVYNPTPYVTTTSVYTGSTTATITQSPSVAGQTGTVVVEVPGNYTTVLRIGAGTTFTQFTATTVGQIGTVIVQVPTTYVTVQSVGPATTYTQFTATTPGQTGTVVVQAPNSYNTVTNVGPATTFTQFTATVPGQTGTVVVQSPTTYTTVTNVGPATTFTQFTATAPGQTGTVVVRLPTTYATITNIGPATTFTQFTATAPGQTGTVVVQSPTTYTTVTNVGPPTTFTQFTATAPGQTGTVVVQQTANYTTVTSVGPAGGSSTTFTQFTATSAGQTGTVVVQVPAQYTTVTSVASTGSVATTYTQLTASTVGQTGTVVVQYPPLQTVTTTTYGTNPVGYTSTVTTVVSSSTSLVAVVGVPVTPFHIFVADLATANPLGYLDVVGTGNGPFNATLSNFANGAYFYFSTTNGQLALAPTSGVSTTPLFSVEDFDAGINGLQFGTNNAATNSPILASLWPEGTIRVADSNNAYLGAFICNGILYQGNGALPAGCSQVTLTPTRSDATYVTTFTTAGSTSSVRTSAATGATVSNNGTVTSTVPTPTAACTAVGFAYTGYTNPYSLPFASDNINPYYLGFNSTYFATPPTALFSGVWTGNANFLASAGTGTQYNTPNVNNQYLALVLRGYFVVPTTGTWSLTTTYSDDVTYLWMGAAATSNGWGETNYNLRSTYQLAPRAPVSFNFIAGQLYPLVVLTANGEGSSGLTIQITSPSGVVYTNTTNFFYQPSCSSLTYLSASAQPTVTTKCAASGIEYINRPNPTLTSYTTTTVGTSVQLGLPPRTITTTAIFVTTTTRIFNPNDYSPPTASPYTTRNFAGVVGDLGYGTSTPNSATVYGRGPYDVNQVVMFLRGYFLPNVTGAHTFTLNQPRDIGWAWIGPEAINGFNTTNADISAALVGGVSVSSVQTLTQGVRVPMRLAFANQGGGYSYSLQVTDPNGLIKTVTSGMFLQPMCGTTSYTLWT